MRIGFLGGDARMDACAALIEADGHTVLRSYKNETLPACLETAELLVLPSPATRDGVTVSGTDIPFSALAGCALPMFGGFLPDTLRGDVFDLASDECFLLKNAALTAEGGIASALGASGCGFYGLTLGVIGAGRIARLLLHKLSAFGAPITLYARRASAREEARLCGIRALPLAADTLFTEDILFNTVPAPVFTGTKVSRARYICDLGGGMPAALEGADGTRVPVTACKGVPGVFSPEAAGRVVYEGLRDYLASRSFPTKS